MVDSGRVAVVLWTGGKDSALALHEAMRADYHILALVTFVPQKPVFLAHPLSFMELQAKAMELSHEFIEIREPFRPSYEKAIQNLKRRGIQTLVTGDIAEVGGQPNWISECSKAANMNVFHPLWGRDRLELLQNLYSNHFKVIFSCVKNDWLSADWVGKEIDLSTIEELCRLHERNGIDLCGEQGEFHTLVTDAPQFKKRIQIDSFSQQVTESMAYIDIEKTSLISK
jgi:diphthine-ammonia ligase